MNEICVNQRNLWTTGRGIEMKININGKAEDTNAVTIHDLVEEKELNPEYVIVEHNHNIVKRDQWKNVQLKADDNIELLSIVGGG